MRSRHMFGVSLPALAAILAASVRSLSALAGPSCG